MKLQVVQSRVIDQTGTNLRKRRRRILTDWRRTCQCWRRDSQRPRGPVLTLQLCPPPATPRHQHLHQVVETSMTLTSVTLEVMTSTRTWTSTTAAVVCARTLPRRAATSWWNAPAARTSIIRNVMFLQSPMRRPVIPDLSGTVTSVLTSKFSEYFTVLKHFHLN